MCNYLIPNIFHFINLNEQLEDTIPIYSYYSIKSIIQLNKPEVIYFHTNHEYNDYLWNELKNSCNFIILKVNNNYNEELFNDQLLKNKLIYKILNEYGGIYFEIGSLCIQPLTNFRLYNFFKNNTDKVIGSEKESYMVFKYLHNINNDDNKFLNSEFGKIKINDITIKNHLIDEKSYTEVFRNNSDNIIYTEIYNYSFSNYFNIINKAYFVLFEDISFFKKYEKINIYKITIYNLLIRYILTYNLNQNSSEICDMSLYKDKFLLINNIDKIIWINLDRSVNRKENMDNILKNIPIQNERFSALDGSMIENINEKYFYCINNEMYPNYTNKEYAVLATHLNVIKQCCSYTNDNIHLIMEDDISLDFIKYWNKDISTIINECPDDWEIIMLSYFSPNINYKELYNKWNNQWSAAAYLLNTKKVRNKIELLQKKNDENNDFKWICNKNSIMVSDSYIFSKFKTYVYKYPYFTFPNNNDSTIHEDHISYHKLYKLSNYMVLENNYFNNL
jgi:hypothetical protein